MDKNFSSISPFLTQSPRTTLGQYPTKESTVKGTHYNPGVSSCTAKSEFYSYCREQLSGQRKVGEEHPWLIHKSMSVQEFPNLLEKVF